MPELTVVANATAKPGREAELERALRAVVGPTHEEPGCLHYSIHRGTEDRTAYLTIERWSSKDAVDRHMTAPHIQTLLKTVPDLLAEPPHIIVYEQLREGRPDKSRF